MSRWNWRSRQRQRSDLPTEIYISVVDSLYQDARTLIVGSIAIILAMFLTAWKTGEPLLYLCTLALTAVVMARARGMSAYQRERPLILTGRDASRWEFRYAFGTSVHYVLLGVWCLLAFALTSDTFVQFVSITSTVAYLIGVTGRNFGSSRLVAIQILCAAPLMVLSLLLTGDVYYAIYSVLFINFFVAMKFISDRLRETLMDAVVTSRENTLLAGRFDAALNNMPLGLCMFDADRRLVVINRRGTELLGVSADDAHQGISARKLMHSSMRAGTFVRENAERLADEIENGPSGRSDEDIEIETRNGRTFALTFEPMTNRGSVVLIEDITDKKASAAKIEHLARYDALTGLPNRTFFHDQMEVTLSRLKRTGEACAALFIDLDQFKQINDTMGHPFGDALLCVVAERLRRIARPTDIIARFGGDEFVILQYPISSPDDASSLARRVVAALGEPCAIDHHQVVIGASIGISVAPLDAENADHLLKNADMALYRTKSEGRGAWRFFETDMDVKAQARRNLEVDLRRAVSEGSFRLYYQPLIDLKSRKISTCEALLRWPHPDRGMVSPAEFIPLAEEMGLIVEIGDWVLMQACNECTQWPADTRVAVNLSPIQFRRGNVVKAVQAALEKSGLPAERLELEITESVLIQDTNATRAVLAQLRDMGVRISLDDFGTGYSSLSYLHSFPLHKVKIDRSFLQGISSSERSRTLLRGVARLSKELGLSVTVEGVETDEELELVLQEAGVDEAQGYLFSPAIPSSGIRELLVRPALTAIKVA
ncbi:MAG TPA: EAL domain-containing protein [Xanthobacteraceae bacterium]|nr:EAL domain-containing protein [Xanthobacteraceae bacterium]